MVELWKLVEAKSAQLREAVLVEKESLEKSNLWWMGHFKDKKKVQISSEFPNFNFFFNLAALFLSFSKL